MYKLNENPFIEIEISDDCTTAYESNLDLFLSKDEFKIIKFNALDTIKEKLILKFVNKYDQKLFILPLCLRSNIEFKNVLFYQEIELCNSFEDDKLKIENVDITFLNYTGDKLREDSKIFNLLNQKDTGKKFFVTKETSKINLQNYEEAISIIISKGIKLLFNTMYKTRSIIMEHPCNAYMCSGRNCHSNKSLFPRYLFITEDGVFPYHCENLRYRFFEDISIKFYNDLLEEFNNYRASDKNLFFVEANRLIYKNYVLPSILEVLPWNYMLDNIVKEEKLC